MNTKLKAVTLLITAFSLQFTCFSVVLAHDGPHPKLEIAEAPEKPPIYKAEFFEAASPDKNKATADALVQAAQSGLPYVVIHSHDSVMTPAPEADLIIAALKPVNTIDVKEPSPTPPPKLVTKDMVLLRGLVIGTMYFTVIVLGTDATPLNSFLYAAIAGFNSAVIQYHSPRYERYLQSKSLFRYRRDHEAEIPFISQVFKDLPILVPLSLLLNAISHEILGGDLYTAPKLAFDTALGLSTESLFLVLSGKVSVHMRQDPTLTPSETHFISAGNRLMIALFVTIPQAMSILGLPDVAVYSAFTLVGFSGVALSYNIKWTKDFVVALNRRFHRVFKTVQEFQDGTCNYLHMIFSRP